MGTVTMQVLASREDWLSNRNKGLGGSDISAVLGLNPWMTNAELWEIKTGRRERKNLDGNELVQYGHDAEPLLRQLFALDYPEYTVFYEDNNSFTNSAYPWALASLDGWLLDSNGRRGILEIKTTQKAWTDGHVPDNYYCQVLFYMAVYEADFAVIKAQQKWNDAQAGVKAFTTHYHIERSEVIEDIELLMTKGAEFWRYVEADKRPPLILNI